jgi:hypothetical protein
MLDLVVGRNDVDVLRSMPCTRRRILNVRAVLGLGMIWMRRLIKRARRVVRDRVRAVTILMRRRWTIAVRSRSMEMRWRRGGSMGSHSSWTHGTRGAEDVLVGRRTDIRGQLVDNFGIASIEHDFYAFFLAATDLPPLIDTVVPVVASTTSITPFSASTWENSVVHLLGTRGFRMCGTIGCNRHGGSRIKLSRWITLPPQ